MPRSTITAIASLAIIAAGGPAFAGNLDWSGVYAGTMFGYGTGKTTQYLPYYSGTPQSQWSIAGAAKPGLALSYLRQIGPAVFGAIGDIADIDVGGAVTLGIETHVSWLETARGITGISPLDHVLVYGTGGAAFALVDSLNFNQRSGETARAAIGWTAGGGVQYAVDPRWVLTAEFLHVDFGRVDLGYANYSTSARFDLVRVGVDLRLTN